MATILEQKVDLLLAELGYKVEVDYIDEQVKLVKDKAKDCKVSHEVHGEVAVKIAIAKEYPFLEKLAFVDGWVSAMKHHERENLND